MFLCGKIHIVQNRRANTTSRLNEKDSVRQQNEFGFIGKSNFCFNRQLRKVQKLKKNSGKA